jgi:hypothetical protein
MKGLAAVCVAAGIGAACTRTAPIETAAPPPREHQAVRQLIGDALAADAALHDADSLYLIGAIVIADGASRHMAPRYAGIQQGGRVAITGSALEITPYLAWGSVEYRWTADNGGTVVFGRATFVLERLGGVWRIKHAHSSHRR